MPSSQLSTLCDLIEKQNTDHFAKFYMYVSLLNTLTTKNKTFAGGLPKYAGSFSNKDLNLGGDLPIQFTEQLSFYARTFPNTQPHWLKTLQEIVMTYIRRGKVSDLAHIIDQMLFHLAAIHGKQSHNNDIYKGIDFDNKKESLTQFIDQISAFNHQLLATADSGCNATLSALAAVTGFVLILASITSIAPLIIGLPLVLGGAYATYHYVTKAKEQAEDLIKKFDAIGEKAGEIAKSERSLSKNANHYAFFTATFKTLPYAAVTVGEQLMFDESTQQLCSGFRSNLDRMP
ncbi:Uncharacterised protein [Legionella steigerwaltii]|uniref:Uncharacterized protein n=1 Tax=Legionella steigerwaltii TaxID=460 RepID=A0A378LB36_9GAMM|nr:hypothetical protein [Legionella steigerwaltii]KTD80794.1 hypothetical protein Lstg_0021 [Legionella steigerwaltii]STY23520.1 Uncharacterised protein [Legionella steigerwaltii]